MKIDKETFTKIAGKENVITNEVELRCYSRDMSVHQGIPDMVILPRKAEQVSEILQIANKQGIPVTPRGAATSVVGAIVPCFGGIVLDMCRMNEIKEVRREDAYVTVDPGIVCGDLNKAIAGTGLFFPPDPGSSGICTVGGMIATNASGIRAVKYGTTKDYVMALQVIMADGKEIRTGTLAPKSSEGYDLTGLMVGSEGTLGVITEATLRLRPIPAYTIFARVGFKTIEDAGTAVAEIFAKGIPISACEVLDKTSIEVVKKMMGVEVSQRIGCLLFIEMDGHPAAVKDCRSSLHDICLKHHALETDWSDVPEERLAMWQARKGLVPSLSMAKRGQRLIPLVEDFGVPISRIPETIREIEKIGNKLDFPIACFGHVGDGNLHAVIVMDVRKKEEWEKTRIVSEELLNLALRLKGTLTAEHGVGIAKAPYIRKGLGSSLDVMRDIKSALDPKGTLNPGKMALDDSVKDIYDYFAFSPAIKGLNSLGEEIDNEILSCIQCGFCRAACPVFGHTYLSSMNTRGRLILAYDMLAGTVEPSKELADVFYQCTACFNCGVVCPAQVKVTDIIQSVREKLVCEGYLPEIFKKLVANVEQHGNPFGKPKEQRTDILPKDSVKRIADLSQESPEAETPEKCKSDKTKESPILLFLGCTSAYADSQIVPSVMQVLKSAGVDYNVLGNEEYCCGYPAYIIGASSEFKKCVDKNVEAISRLNPESLVAVCSSCRKTLEKLYPDMNLKISHAVEFIEELIVSGRLQFSKKKRTPRKVVYHDPCSMGRHMGIYESPRAVLRSIPGVELVEFEMNREQAKCCGGGGGFKVYDKSLSEELGYTRILQAVDVGAEVVTTSCPTCKERLEIAAKRLAREKGIELKVTYVAELVAEAVA